VSENELYILKMNMCVLGFITLALLCLLIYLVMVLRRSFRRSGRVLWKRDGGWGEER